MSSGLDTGEKTPGISERLIKTPEIREDLVKIPGTGEELLKTPEIREDLGKNT